MSKTVAIVGAGIVGVATAINLQRDGFDVVLIDKSGPAEGASFGNAGVLASCSVIPVTTPGLIRKAPKMLFKSDQPLFLKWGYLPKLLPWLFRYLSHANAKDVEKTAAAMTPLVSDSLADHQALAAGTDAAKFIIPTEYIYAYNSREHFGEDGFGWGVRHKNGFRWDELEGQELREYEPVLSSEIGFAARLKNHGRISDPGEYVKALARHVTDNGGQFVKAEVNDIIEENGRVTGVVANGETIRCDAVLIATGAWSKPLARVLGVNVPLESERGYHVELFGVNKMPKVPVMVAARKFVATPMDGRLRLAGVVEFGGLEAPPSPKAFELLKNNIRAVIPDLTWTDEKEWMGHRPATANSIPIIGESPKIKGAFLGFGHHHVGLTGGPKTGRLLAQLIAGRQPNVDMSAYSPAQFAD